MALSGDQPSDTRADRPSVLLLAAGSGERLGRGAPKAFVPLGGRPMLWWSLQAIGASGVLDPVVLVVPEGREGEGQKLAAAALEGCHVSVSVVTGGDSRQDSVRRGIEALPSTATHVLCHDAARPLATPELFRVVASALARDGVVGVVPVLPVSDTVKRIRGDRVVETVGPREQLGLAQTPQGFVVSALLAAHRQAVAARMEATDDAMLLEQAGHRVDAVPGERSNLKVTTAEDLLQAELMMRKLSTQPHGWA